MVRVIYFLFIFLIFVVLHVVIFDLILYFLKEGDVVIISFSVAIFLAFLGFIFFYSYKKISLNQSVSLALNVCFLLFFLSLVGPIFIDRSDAYKLIETADKGKTISLEQYKTLSKNRDIEKTFEENSRLAKLKKLSDGVYTPTTKTFYIKKVSDFLKTIYFPTKKIVIKIE